MSDITYMSQEGYDNLKKEIEHLKMVERPSLSKQIGEARDKGDLSENAEYDAAKEAQGLLEMKIAKLEEVFGNSRVLDKSKVDLSKIGPLSIVRLMNQKIGKEVTYTLVSENEANFKEGKISMGSPIGKALAGKKLGDIVEITVPAGVITFEVLEITI
ncbi:MAG: transcription elongation factor GreA [Bacteroidia bacterium]|jgi:transcription elongation factor GreA|nr:transcription elongation factor GreA [Bacteroidia bacterium]